MNTLEALYFPGTAIYSARQYPVFLLLDKIHLLQPVEALEATDNSADIFITSGRCQEHTPCPLGGNRERFLRLIRDIRERKDDYAAQLSALTIASLSARKPSVDDTSRGIVSSLLTTHGVATQPADEQDGLLWQARLVLKMGEILDQEEEEVAMQMALLDDREDSLFKALQGEMDEDEETLLEELQQIRERLSEPAAATVKNRLNAWSRLYLAAAQPECSLWLTHLGEAADILLEKYETAVRMPAQLLGELELPANIGWSRNEAMDQSDRFREGHQELLTAVKQALAAGATEELAALARRWSTALEEVFPGAKNGRTTLAFHQMAALSCGALLGKAGGSGNILAVVR